MNTELIVAGITAITTSIVGPIVVHYVQVMLEKRKKNILTASIEINQLIDTKLDEVKRALNADRIWLIQFHNGGNFYPTGKSIQKFSIVYELVSTSIVPCQSQFQNIPVSLFSRAMNHLHKGKTITIPDTSVADRQFEGFTSVVPSASVKSTYLFPLFNIKNEFIGIVGVDYVEKKKDLAEAALVNMELEISTIGGVLNNYLSS